jgi:preprotein translocase subunit SecE
MEEIEKLKQENKELKEKLKFFENSKEELFSHRVFIESRKRFLQWTSVVLVVITAFGFVSAKALINMIRDEIKEQGTEKIIQEIKDDFINEHKDEIRGNIVKELRLYISGQIDETLREEMIKRFSEIENVKLTDTSINNLSNAVIESFEGELYMVISGSSPKRIDLQYLI